jgi:hypothetical protein
VTVSCPLDCEYLREARKHEKGAPLDQAGIPNPDIRVTEEFLDGHQGLLADLVRVLVAAAMEPPEAIDFDMREALEALIRTQRTMQSGIYYETLPANPLAARVCRAVRDGIEAFRKHETEVTGISKTRDADVLGLLVFLQRFELDRNNGRPRGRAFIDSLVTLYAAEPAAEPTESSSLILP